MDISDQELRALVRDAIETVRGHGSHGLLTLIGGGDPEGRCLIEPAVPCTHCGYCQSLGH